MAVKDPVGLAKEAMATLRIDRDQRLERIDEYERGIQDGPYMPDSADEEYRLHAQRCITNVIPFVIGTPAQGMYVDSFRRGRSSSESVAGASAAARAASTAIVQPEWDHWQRSGLDAKQSSIYRGALKFGHAFTVTEKVGNTVKTRGLSALRTVALYEDPVSDTDALFALTVTKWAKGDTPGEAIAWDDTHSYKVKFKSFEDLTTGVSVVPNGAHGASVNPVTRFAAAVDLEGRTCGVVEPLIPVQDRLNQSVFDLLVVQSYASFTVRTISGMAPPSKMRAIDHDGKTIPNPAAVDEDEIADWVPVIDPNTGRPIPDEVNLNARRVFWAEDEDTKFGTLEGTPLDGFIKAIELAFEHIAALSSTPPHHLLGKIANLSAEALTAAETALRRKINEFQATFGESWERVFRVAAEIGGYAGMDDFHGEVIWRDMDHESMSQVGDALGKFAESLEIPKRGLWHRVPGVSTTELAQWEQMHEEENAELALARAGRVGSTERPGFRARARIESPEDRGGEVAA